MAFAAVWSAHGLGLDFTTLMPRGDRLSILQEFAAAALAPAVDYEAEVPSGTVALVWKVLDSLRRTLMFAAAGMSLALVLGLPLGVLTSTSWWRGPARGNSWVANAGRRLGISSIFIALRATIAGMRSVHELLWAVLLLAALGLHPFSAVCAIAIPYGGTLAKVFSEILDETSTESADALRSAGASKLQVFLFGLFPRALPDLASYAFYRFECAVRSSAVLGFFGFPTVGYFVKIAFNNQRYHEVWSYLWALIAVVVVLELASGGLRKRVVVR